MRERPLSINVDGGDLTLAGAVDETSISSLRTLLADLLESGDPVSVDLGGVDYLPSFAIGVLAKARSRALARDLPFELLAPEGTPAQRVLQIAAIPYVGGRSGRGSGSGSGDPSSSGGTDGDGSSRSEVS